MKYCILILLVCGNYFVTASTVTFRLVGLRYQKASVFSVKGEELAVIDTPINLVDNVVTFQLQAANQYGLYRFSLNTFAPVDFFFDGGDIAISLYGNSSIDSVTVEKSDANKLFKQFVQLSRDYKNKSEVLLFVLRKYPRETAYYAATLAAYNALWEEYQRFNLQAAKTMPGTLITSYIQSAALPHIPPELTGEQQLLFLKSHALDNVSFTDTRLINTDVFTSRAIEYISYYRNPQLSKEQLEASFKPAVDSLLSKAKINPIVYSHVSNYLIEGFKRFGFDTIIDFILERYVLPDDVCLDGQTDAVLQKRMNQGKLLKVGVAAPALQLPDSIKTVNPEGKPFQLLIFYSTTCPHCQTLLKQLQEDSTPRLKEQMQIIAVSLDTQKAQPTVSHADIPHSWLKVCDYKGWEGTNVLRYYIYATPTMFLLDKDNVILAKPVSYSELVQFINLH